MLKNLVYTTALGTMEYFACTAHGATPSGTCGRRAGACTRSRERKGGGEGGEGVEEEGDERAQHQQHTHKEVGELAREWEMTVPAGRA